jgi:hypothetical protein
MFELAMEYLRAYPAALVLGAVIASATFATVTSRWL